MNSGRKRFFEETASSSSNPPPLPRRWPFSDRPSHATRPSHANREPLSNRPFTNRPPSAKRRPEPVQRFRLLQWENLPEDPGETYRLVYTDGSCPGNASVASNEISGCGVWYSPGDKRNPGVPNPWPPHSNQRGEMSAVLLALRQERHRREQARMVHQPDPSKVPLPLLVVSDSNYTLRGLTEWMLNWKKRSWRTAGGKPVANQDLWKELDRELSLTSPALVVFCKCPGHDDIPGNEEADALAKAGCFSKDKVQAVKNLGRLLESPAPSR